jgi:hypothetical protein
MEHETDVEGCNETNDTSAAPGAQPSYVSERKRAANARNALNSTGPKTVAGKATSRLNALKHGLLAKTVLVPELGETPEEFDEILGRLSEEWQPEGITEELLVVRVAQCHVRLARAARAEGAELSLATVGQQVLTYAVVDQKDERYISDEVRKSCKKDPETAVLVAKADKALAEACAVVPDACTIDRLLRYETTIERQLYRALSELERLQRRRRGELVTPPVNVVLTSGG